MTKRFPRSASRLSRPIAKELWCKPIGDPEMGWKTLSVLKKQACRSRVRTEVAIRRKKVDQP
jgi:hypothetical protein